MTAPTGSRDDRMDEAARRAHTAALQAMPSRTLAQLRPRATPAPAPSARWRPAWTLATVGAAVFAAALGLRTLTDGPTAPVPAAVEVATTPSALPRIDDPLLALDEDPDLFLWLASTDAQPLAME